MQKRRHNLLLVLMMLIMFGTATVAVAEQPHPQRFTLVINMAPAVCAMDATRHNLRQCQEGFSLTISSLQPDVAVKDEEDCNSNSSAALNPLQSRVVERVMPDEKLRREDWQRNGGCTGMTASNYFRTIANYAARLRVPPEFNAAGEVPMQRANLIHQLQSLNPGLPADGIQLRCVSNYHFNAPVLTEMRVCYSQNGQYVSCPAAVRSNCPNSFVVQGAP